MPVLPWIRVAPATRAAASDLTGTAVEPLGSKYITSDFNYLSLSSSAADAALARRGLVRKSPMFLCYPSDK